MNPEDFAHDSTLFLNVIQKHNPNLNAGLIKKAFECTKKLHGDKRRESGELYLIHPIEVVIILLENNISESAVIAAALLHDTVEDTSLSIEDIEKDFGAEIAQIVSALTKIEKNKFGNKEKYDYYAYNSENLRKILLATAKDVRVMFIKIADRLHNMRTLSIFREEKKQRIAKQTLRVYAPLAEKLGLYKIKSELEDLALLYLEPDIFKFLAKRIELTKEERDNKTKKIVNTIIKILDEHKIQHKISGRAKHFYSIYKKMIEENKTLEEIYDLYGIRIILQTEEECYTVEKILNDTWPIEKSKKTGRELRKDFIKEPKSNGYQSLHINYLYENTVVEVQVRTEEMNTQAEMGVAKHWKYKATERDKKLDKKIDILRQLVSWKLHPDNKAAAETYKLDIFGGEIVCITPKGDPIILKEGSTPIDFAYAIHSKIGDSIERVEINGEKGVISQELHSGDIVNIITSQKKTANKQWLNYVKTNEAKTKLRQALGMTKQTKQKKQVTPEIIEEYIDYQLSKQIQVIGKKAPIKISKCCSPKWGEPITGYYTKDKKITIHRKDCPDRFALDQKSEVVVKWGNQEKEKLMVFIIAEDVPGIVAKILDLFLKEKIDIVNIFSEEKKRNILLSLELKRDKLEKITTVIKRIDALKEVSEARADF
jgi:guanosine-3',5'-bis(diphosphate) 3'-pyrophosphohydrolase